MVTEHSTLAAATKASTDKASADRDGARKDVAALPRQIPWGYGHDRVTACAVDPNQLFVYWELREETLEAARRDFTGMWTRIVLRVYDTSGRIFDGYNAHSYFDREVQRSDRQWFCDVRKPASSAHVEIGVLGADGRFKKIARSGRVDFPRVSPAAPQPLEWMRVVSSTFDIASREVASGGPGAHGGQHLNGHGSAPSQLGEAASSHGASATDAFEIVEREELLSHTIDGSVVERREYEWDSGWQIDGGDPELFYRTITNSWEEFGFAMRSWESGPIESSWEAGPFTYPTEVVTPSIEQFQTPTQIYKSGAQVRVLHGPWQVVIRGINPRAGHRVLGRWEVHRSWLSVQTRASEGLPRQLDGSRGFVAGGASDRLPIGASELRLRGASEIFFLGASERRLMGASELRFVGASQLLARGASERRFQAASEWRLGGASERRLMGASERRLMGASERRLMGASERRLGGASEGRLGGSERRLGDVAKTVTARSVRED